MGGPKAAIRKPKQEAPGDERPLTGKRRAPETAERPAKRLKTNPLDTTPTARKRRRVIEDADDEVEVKRKVKQGDVTGAMTIRKIAAPVKPQPLPVLLKPGQKRKADASVAAADKGETPNKLRKVLAPKKTKALENTKKQEEAKELVKDKKAMESQPPKEVKELKKGQEPNESQESKKSKATETTAKPPRQKVVGSNHVQSIMPILAATLDLKVLRSELDPITPAEEHAADARKLISSFKQAEKDGKTVANTLKDLPTATLPGGEQRCLEATQLLAALAKASKSTEAKKVPADYLFQCVFAHFNRKKNGKPLWDDASQQDTTQFLMATLNRLRDLAVDLEGEAGSEDAQMTYLDDQFRFYTDNTVTCSECGHVAKMTGADWALPLTITPNSIAFLLVEWLTDPFLAKERTITRSCENCCACTAKCGDCERCAKKVEGTRKHVGIKKAPKYLTVRIGRTDGADNKKRIQAVELPIFGTAKIKVPGSTDDPIEYKLKAVVKHVQHAENDGRFVTYVMDQDDCFRYSGKEVEHIEENLESRLRDNPKELSHLIVLEKQDKPAKQQYLLPHPETVAMNPYIDCIL
ncbi:hypothetical protein H2199_003899 [Coniosporium tulheliwenetii]|uniref:Uncharacterized protein n=1 Tax=Coniosporium tulheliwenetii TaxID=3383036 RepID=A0ACC2ZAA5_9PEZI|nr:hypothetical protein H2199_003899 [Cladosporium sp. JES 115]